MARAHVAAALLSAAAVTGCARDGTQRTAAGGLQDEVQQARTTWPAGLAAVIDSATAAYDAEDFERATALFRRATEIAPQLTTGWYGVYIAEHARGRVAAADSALQRALGITADSVR